MFKIYLNTMNSIRINDVFFRKLLVLHCGIFFALASAAFGDEPTRLFDFNEVGVSFSLPTNWITASADDLQKANDTADSREPNHAYRYVAILNNAPPPTGRYLSSDYIIIQRTPGEITPDEVLKSFPTLKLLGNESQKRVQDYVKNIEFSNPYIDSRLNLVVLPHQSKMFDGSILYVRYYLIMTRNAVIGVNVYAHEDSKKKIFSEVETGLTQLKIQKDFQVDENWFSTLKKLVGEQTN
jgi:hypothetical protein